MNGRSWRGVLVLFCAAAIAACRGTHPAPRYAWNPKADFDPLKTYAWWNPPGFTPPHGDSIIDGEFLDQHIRGAVDRSLGAKGMQKVDPAAAQMFVTYSTGDTGVSDEVKDPNYAWLTGYENTMYEKSRSVQIDIRDRAKVLIWRGSISRLEGENPDGVARELNHEVDTLLAHFPPKPGMTPSQ